MNFYVFDTSALLKRYVAEVGSRWVESITVRSANNRIFVAQFTSVEVVSGLMRRKQSGELSARQAKALRLLVDRHFAREHSEVAYTTALGDAAKDLLERYQLRAADAS